MIVQLSPLIQSLLDQHNFRIFLQSQLLLLIMAAAKLLWFSSGYFSPSSASPQTSCRTYRFNSQLFQFASLISMISLQISRIKGLTIFENTSYDLALQTRKEQIFKSSFWNSMESQEVLSILIIKLNRFWSRRTAVAACYSNTKLLSILRIFSFIYSSPFMSNSTYFSKSLGPENSFQYCLPYPKMLYMISNDILQMLSKLFKESIKQSTALSSSVRIVIDQSPQPLVNSLNALKASQFFLQKNGRRQRLLSLPSYT